MKPSTGLEEICELRAMPVSSQRPFYPSTHIPRGPYTHREIFRCGTPDRTEQAGLSALNSRKHCEETGGNQRQNPKSGHKKTSLQAGSFVVDSDERPTLLRL